jgi:hypothetical protein
MRDGSVNEVFKPAIDEWSQLDDLSVCGWH